MKECGPKIKFFD